MKTIIKNYIDQIPPIVNEFLSYDEFKAYLIGRLESAFLDRPFDIAWARTVLPDGYTEGWRWYRYKRQICISPETDGENYDDTGRFILKVDDADTTVEMKTRAQFLALCFGLGIRLPQKATGDQ